MKPKSQGHCCYFLDKSREEEKPELDPKKMNLTKNEISFFII